MLPMAVTLTDILSIEVVRAADPVVFHGYHLLDRPVRWVHTSELVEAASLLRGGELLLTTGLGLAGRGPVAQASYIDELANRDVAAVALELGWTFPEVPGPLRDAAIRRDLPLIGLRALVPFVEITEAVQTVIIGEELSRLRAERDCRAVLDAVLLDGGGVADVVAAVGRHLGVPVALESATGRMVALHGFRSGSSFQLKREHGSTRAVTLFGAPWGWLHIMSTTDDAMLDAMRRHAPAALALVLGQDTDESALRASLAQRLIDDLVAGRLDDDPAEVHNRVTLVDPAVASARRIAAIAVTGFTDAEAEIGRYVSAASVAELGPSIVATQGPTVLALVAVGAADGHLLSRQLQERVTALLGLRGSPGTPVAVVSILAPGLSDAARALDETRSGAELLARVGAGVLAASADDLAGLRLIHRLASDPDAEHLVASQIGPLLRYDAANGTELLRTLREHLAAGLSKTELAARLHLRRQTLYQRLAKIEELIGPLDREERRSTLMLAIQLHQLRLAEGTRRHQSRP
jgi:PucR family transcriptional regulator, purine catabolism regulatory protein